MKHLENRGVHNGSEAAMVSLARRLATSLAQRARAAGRTESVFVPADQVRALLTDPSVEVLELDALSGTLVGGVRTIDIEERLRALEGSRR